MCWFQVQSDCRCQKIQMALHVHRDKWHSFILSSTKLHYSGARFHKAFEQCREHLTPCLRVGLYSISLQGLLQPTTIHGVAESNRNLLFYRRGVRNQDIGRVALLSENLLHASPLGSGGRRHSWIYRCITPSSISVCVYVFMWPSPCVCVFI